MGFQRNEFDLTGRSRLKKIPEKEKKLRNRHQGFAPCFLPSRSMGTIQSGIGDSFFLCRSPTSLRLQFPFPSNFDLVCNVIGEAIVTSCVTAMLSSSSPSPAMSHWKFIIIQNYCQPKKSNRIWTSTIRTYSVRTRHNCWSAFEIISNRPQRNT